MQTTVLFFLCGLRSAGLVTQIFTFQKNCFICIYKVCKIYYTIQSTPCVHVSRCTLENVPTLFAKVQIPCPVDPSFYQGIPGKRICRMCRQIVCKSFSANVGINFNHDRFKKFKLSAGQSKVKFVRSFR